jgi:hypothetical protein
VRGAGCDVRRSEQPDYLDGFVAAGGPSADSLAVQLRGTDRVYSCTASEEVARRLAAVGSATPIRAFGTAAWTRQDGGGWALDAFSIEEFVTLDDRSLADALTDLAKVASPPWPTNERGEIDFTVEP